MWLEVHQMPYRSLAFYVKSPCKEVASGCTMVMFWHHQADQAVVQVRFSPQYRGAAHVSKQLGNLEDAMHARALQKLLGSQACLTRMFLMVASCLLSWRTTGKRSVPDIILQPVRQSDPRVHLHADAACKQLDRNITWRTIFEQYRCT